jgi:hypothetical protein
MSRGGHREGAGRKGGWKNSETQVIRVPKIFASQLLDIARNLDLGFQVTVISPELDQAVHMVEEIQLASSHPDQMDIFSLVDSSNDFVTESNDSDLESVTESNDSDLEFATKSKTPPNRADGKRWLSSKDAWILAKERGCDRNLEGFKKWSARNPEKCSEIFSLLKLPILNKGSNVVPAFEDLRYNEDPDCQDF